MAEECIQWVARYHTRIDEMYREQRQQLAALHAKGLQRESQYQDKLSLLRNAIDRICSQGTLDIDDLADALAIMDEINQEHNLWEAYYKCNDGTVV